MQTDPLSALASDLFRNYPDHYGRLVVENETPPAARSLLQHVKSDELLAIPVKSADAAQAMLAGLWLWHDDLQISHQIVQDSSDGSHAFWHAILHRREGDFSNAKYWFARCRNHPVLATMAPFANDVLHPLPADKSFLRLVRDGWDPNAFVDLVEQVHNRPADVRHGAAVALQKLEWRLLFDHCTREAAGQ